MKIPVEALPLYPGESVRKRVFLKASGQNRSSLRLGLTAPCRTQPLSNGKASREISSKNRNPAGPITAPQAKNAALTSAGRPITRCCSTLAWRGAGNRQIIRRSTSKFRKVRKTSTSQDQTTIV